METLADIDFLVSFPNEFLNEAKLKYIYAVLDAFNSQSIKSNLIKNQTSISIDNGIFNAFAFILSKEADDRIRSLDSLDKQLDLLSKEVKAIPQKEISMDKIEEVLQTLKRVIESNELYSQMNEIKYSN